jgi:sugar (pentulose or hexulose) kinase
MFIGIDVSTTATKALVIDSNNVVLSRGYHAFKPLVSNVPAGRAEQEVGAFSK